jgi:TolB-like protein/Tfp pilus assembly protein PilF
VYLVGSWVILQLYDIVGPAVGLSEDSIIYLILVLLVGFPLVILFCWTFEITPQGLVLTKAVGEDRSISRQTGRKIDRVIIGLLTVALGFFMFEYFSRSDDAAEVVTAANEAAVDEGTTNATKVVTAASKVAQELADPRPSVAVMPFANMSSDEENEYFADGLSEELLNVLAQIQGLRVAARTSSFHYKGTNPNLTEVGEALGVEHILEGSVRKSGNRVRITTQLISAQDGFHLWSKTFDRELEDIFAIQDEIAREVSGAMQVTLLEPGIQVGSIASTTNVAAHDAYLRGKQSLYQRTEEEVRHAMDMFQLANKMDPEYAPALLGVASTALIAYNNHNSMTFLESMDIAKDALDKAADLDFKTSEYWATLGLYHHHNAPYDSESIALAEEAYQKAITLNPNNVLAYIWYASLLAQDKPGDNRQQAYELELKALQLDPLNRVINGNHQLILARMGQDDEAIENLERLRRLDPTYPTYSTGLVFIHMSRGDVEEALVYLDDVPADDVRGAYISMNLAFYINDHEALDQVFARIPLDSYGFEAVEEVEFAFRRSRPELTARAEVFLLQPDYDGLWFSLMNRLEELGEYELVKQLIENTFPEFAKDTPVVIPNRMGVCDAYLSAIYALGETERAQRYARTLLDERSWQRRNELGGKGIEDALSYIVLGQREKAIAEFEAAASEGWRRFYLDRVPMRSWYDTIADEPRIQSVKATMDRHVASVREPILEALRKRGLLDESFALR